MVIRPGLVFGAKMGSKVVRPMTMAGGMIAVQRSWVGTLEVVSVVGYERFFGSGSSAHAITPQPHRYHRRKRRHA